MNMYCTTQKSNSQEFRDNYDDIFGKRYIKGDPEPLVSGLLGEIKSDHECIERCDDCSGCDDCDCQEPEKCTTK